MKKVGNSKKFGISILGILVILILAFLILMPKSNAYDNAIVYFECENLKKALNEKLGRNSDSDITIKEMHRINGYVDLGNRDITSMKGLEHLINVTTLNVRENQISKIEGLHNLIYLTELDLGKNQISRIGGLDRLTKLTGLYFWENQISKIESLDNLTNLKKLSLGNNQITKIEGLDKLTNLRELDLSENQISKMEGLDNLTNLTRLYLMDNQISKIEDLDSLINLTELGLGNNQISKIEGLDKLTNLTLLLLNLNQISKIEGLDKLTKLKVMKLDNQCILQYINSSEFELPKVMYKNEKIEVTISDSFKNNITKIGENRYRIDDEGLKKLKSLQCICRWTKEIKGYIDYKSNPSVFSGRFYAVSTLKEKDLFNEEVVKNKCVKVGEKLDITTLLLNKPSGSSVEVVEDINTNSLGKKRGKIKVIFSDGSFKEIEVEVIVNTFDVQINYLDKKEKLVKSEVKEVKIDTEKLR